jgi:ABC-type dipeptide/oligopeptide/nickel transport system permease component
LHAIDQKPAEFVQGRSSGAIIVVVGAVVVGCWAAYRPNSLADRFSSLLSMTAASIPDFWFAITGVWLFAVLLGVLADEGLILRENDAEDHRRVLVRLTPSGQAAMDRFFDAVD